MSEMKNVRKVLITSIMRDEFKTGVKYFALECDGKYKFGSRVARSEPAAYAVLSQTKLDEIIAIGRDTDINENDILEKQMVASAEDLPSDTEKMSDYGFFKYRLCEYINRVDIETSDIYENVPQERQEEIQKVMKLILGEDLSRGFKQVFYNFNLLETIYEKAGITQKKEMNLVKSILFAAMAKENRIYPIEENKEIQISYLPVIKTDDKEDEVTNAQNLVQMLNLSPNDENELELFVDLQAFSLADGYMLFNLLTLLDIDRKYNMSIKAVTSLSDKKDTIAQRLTDVSSRYKTSELISGIEAFINYGHTEIITNYWRGTGIKNSYIDEFLYAMSMVSTGISLCDNEELIAGIKKLIVFSKDKDRASSVDLSMEEIQFIMQVKHAILYDYADIMDENGELDLAKLIEWEYKKGYYQQAMTIIESKTPEILSDRGVLYYARNESDKQKMLVYLNDKYWRETPCYRWGFSEINHWLVKTMPRPYATAKHDMKTPLGTLKARILSKSFEDDKSCGIQLFTVATNMSALEELFECYYSIGTLRNTVCHANNNSIVEEEDTDDKDYTQMNPVLKGVSSEIRKFVSKLNTVLEDVKGKNFTSVLIGNEERTTYFDEHKFYPDNDSERRGSRGSYNRNRRNSYGEKRSDGNGSQSPCSVNVGKNQDNIHISIDISLNGQNQIAKTPAAAPAEAPAKASADNGGKTDGNPQKV